MSVTTANLAVCKACGIVFGVEGRYSIDNPLCQQAIDGRHQIVFVLVVVPLS